MSRKRLFGLMLVLACAILIVLRARYVGSDTIDQRPESQPPPDPPELPEGPIFVVPENPFGVLGAMLALIIALTVFAKAKNVPARK